MDPTVKGALIAALSTLSGIILTQVVELVKLRIEESKEERRLRRTWLRKQNVDRYERVKNWVIQVMAVLDPAPVTWRPDKYLVTEPDKLVVAPGKFTLGELSAQTKRLEELNSQATEVRLFAAGDEQLAKYLQDFINTVNSLGEGRDPDKIEEALSAAAKVTNRAYELMLQVPK